MNRVIFSQAFGTAAEALEHFLSRGIINWGSPVSSLFEDGLLYIQQARATEASGIIYIFSFLLICSIFPRKRSHTYKL